MNKSPILRQNQQMLFLSSCFGADGFKVVCPQTHLMNLIFFCEYTGKMTSIIYRKLFRIPYQMFPDKIMLF